MGAYGAGMSVYSNFIARGHDVVFPKDTAMTIGISTRPPEGGTPPAATPAARPESLPPTSEKSLGD